YGQSDSNELVYYWFTPSDSGGNAKSPLFNVLPHMADTFVNNGLHFASLGYDCVPACQLRTLFDWLKPDCVPVWSELGLTACPAFNVAGHSAGGHLAVTAGACVHWPGELAGLIKGVLPISGVFDLMPLVKTSVNHPLGMNTAQSCRAEPYARPSTAAPGQPPPILAIVGALESPEFTRQSRELCDLLRRHGRQADVNIVPERDHFDIIELLADPADPLSQRILAFIRS
uniref:Abhydrolase_3 domain-containing protein n=1 Tax=Macrostomum lignano TaxID=282301 RepID=A0A1I8FJP9_9PLAT